MMVDGSLENAWLKVTDVIMKGKMNIALTNGEEIHNCTVVFLSSSVGVLIMREDSKRAWVPMVAIVQIWESKE